MSVVSSLSLADAPPPEPPVEQAEQADPPARSWIDRVTDIFTPPQPPPPEAPEDEAPAPEDTALGMPQTDERPGPLDVELSPLVQRMLTDDLLTEAQRRSLQIFHGQWASLGDLQKLPADEQAQIALQRGDVRNPIFDLPDISKIIKAQALLMTGQAAAVEALLQDKTSLEATYLRALAMTQTGQFTEAVALLRPLRNQLEKEQVTDPTELTAAAQALVLLAKLEGQPAMDYFLAMDLLSRVRTQLSPTFVPAFRAEAEILNSKDNRADSFAAWREALALNPEDARTWYLAGYFMLQSFDFDSAQQATEKLYTLSPDGPLGTLLEAQSLVKQRDYLGAIAVLEPAVEIYPTHPALLSELAAALKLQGDDQRFAQVQAKFDQIAPGHPGLLHRVGSALSLARQYQASRDMLEQAIARQPNWPAAHVELGLMLMQKGDDPAAKAALKQATELDPFNVRAANQLKLVNELLTWEKIETDHFVIAYKPGIDAILARDMPEELETIYKHVTELFEHQPTRKTRIDLMPDQQWFAVRITGQTSIWTIAAATGDVLSMTPPRPGQGQYGAFHWPAVVMHEYVHTVTLSQTGNRIPHWFTEACAVSQEPTGRSYDTYQLLAWALKEDKLFALDQINWGFIRPKADYERPLAYQQADWMLEYIIERFGHAKVIAMLEAFNAGKPQTRVFDQVLGISETNFLEDFKTWAQKQVVAWGLGPSALPDTVVPFLKQSPDTLDDAQLAELIEQYPNEPALLKLSAQRAMAGDDVEAARQAVLAYAEARPVDPWVQRALLQLAQRSKDAAAAIGPLQALDKQAMDTGVWAVELAKLHRAAGRLGEADSAIRRALWREPYNPSYRELAATLAVQRGDLERALRQIEALTLLEPEVAQHWLRLAAVAKMAGDDAMADQAARQAKTLNDKLNVERFLKAD